MFLFGRLGSPEHKITDLEDPSPDFSFMVPAESLLVTSRANDGHLMSCLKQVDRVLLNLLGSVLVEGLYSQGAMIEVDGQHCFGSVCEEERGEPYGPIWRRS